MPVDENDGMPDRAKSANSAFFISFSPDFSYIWTGEVNPPSPDYNSPSFFILARALSRSLTHTHFPWEVSSENAMHCGLA
jgi:hypothetical protein